MAIRNSKPLKLVAATSVVIFTLLACFSGVFAWFTSVRAQDTSGNSMAIDSISGKFYKLSLHRHVEGTGDFEPGSTATTVSFNKEAEASVTIKSWNPRDLEKTNMDNALLMGNYNPNHQSDPVLMLIELNDSYTIEEGSSYKINASITKPVEGSDTYEADVTSFKKRYGLKDTDPLEPEFIGKNVGYAFDVTTDDNPLSSIVKYYSTAYEDVDALDAITSETSYDISKSSLTTTGSFFTMTTSTDGTMTYNEDFDDTKDFYVANAGETVKYIAVIFDYYSEALEYIYNINLGDEKLDEDIIKFKCDWNMVV